ncbi:MAG: hypothetical protein AB8I08_21910 [Sandaracinaceae bacterium]
MPTPGRTPVEPAPGMRPLFELAEADVAALGEEVRDLSALRAAGLPLARGWVVPLAHDATARSSSLAEALAAPRAVLSRSQPPAGARTIRVLPWFRTVALSVRAEAQWPEWTPSADLEVVNEALLQLRAQLATPAMAGALAMDPKGLALRVLVADEGPMGRACSVDPDDGDPAHVAVWLPPHRPYRLDRKTMRLLESGTGALGHSVMERAADLADRAQLALGRPVEVDWVLVDGRPAIARVRPSEPVWRFTDEPFHKVALLWHDEGPIAPLAVDGLDKALREDHDATGVDRVRRLYARAYRRLDAGGRRDERRHSFAKAAARAARTISDVADPIRAARGFSRTLDGRLTSFDRDALTEFEDADLARALRERQEVVVEAYDLLDRGRKATRAVLGALEAVIGTIPRECIHGLAAIRRTRARRRLDERLAKAAAQLSPLPASPEGLESDASRRLASLRRELRAERPLGLDVRSPAYGESDAALLGGLRAARDGRAERAEREQRQAIRRLMATARARPLGRGRATLARSLTVMIERLADAKGQVAEGLAAANLRVRALALEIGRRLVERTILDEPDDVLFLYVIELQDALSGEPGAYTARVRLRREEDARWRAFEPPIRLQAREQPRRPTW